MPITAQHSLLPGLFEDYAESLVHVLWLLCREAKTSVIVRRLVFGLIEAYPREITELHTTSEQSLRFKDHRLFYIRARMPMEAALALHDSARETQTLPMRWEKPLADGEYKRIAAPGLTGATRWPNLLLADQAQLPFIAPAWGMARVHSLLPPSHQDLYKPLADAHPAEWIAERLLFDMLDAEALWLGSWHLILPNPLYRRMHERLIPGEAGEADRVQIGFIPRAGQEQSILEQLSMLQREDRPTGKAARWHDPLGVNPLEWPLTGRAEQTAALVFCRQRGLIDGHGAAGFVRRIQITAHVHEGIQTTRLPNAGSGAIRERTVDRYTLASTTELGDALSETEESDRELSARLQRNRHRQRIREQATRYGQYLCQDEEESKQYVLKLIQGAQHDLIIIDPYFRDGDLPEFAAQTKLIGVPVVVWTWTDTLKRPASIDAAVTTTRQNALTCSGATNTDVKVWQSIRDMLPTLNNERSHRIDLMVMTGDAAIFHDRFLIIDGDVWFAGNSLHAIGRRYGMILKLPDPQPVLDAVERLRVQKERVQPFSEWIVAVAEGQTESPV